MLTSEQLADLRAKAEAATPGPWITSKAPTGIWVEAPESAVALVGDSFSGREQGPLNAAFIAAANPATILQLLDMVESLETEAKLTSLLTRVYVEEEMEGEQC